MRKKRVSGKNILLQNDLEKSHVFAMRKMQTLKEALLSAGAQASAMSGSGSCVYGIFSSQRALEEAKKMLHFSFPSCTLFVARPIPYGVKITS